jgi:hypothetical protein
MKRYPLIPAAFTAVLIFLGCSMQALTGGAGEETTNGMVRGTVRNQNGGYARNAQVTLYPVNYDPIKDGAGVQIDTTDSLGRYNFAHIDSGSYAVFAVHSDNRTSTLISGIYVAGDTVTAPTDTLSTTGSIKILPPENADLMYGYVYVLGTNIFTFLNNRNGFVVLDAVPAGTIPTVSYSATNSSEQKSIRYNVKVVSGDTATIWNPAWNYAKQLFLTTTASGADVAGNVIDFPVLIRLTDKNFSFAQAKKNGEDIRFTKSDNTLLPYEIERWDSVAGAAEIWVKVDTVYGNDSAQNITMYWGDPNANSASNSAAVFNTADGFKAVWHFSQDCLDATVDRFNGIDYGASDAEGVIGYSKSFDGTDSIKIPGPINGTASITLSAWVKYDTTDSLGGEVLSLGDDVLIRVDDPRGSLGTMGSYRYDSTFNGYYHTNSGLFLQKTGWRYLTYAVDGAGGSQSFFIDGVLSASTQNSRPVYYHQGRNISIGTHGYNWGKTSGDYTECHFIGVIDEVRICGVARSPDWIKLCYKNQRADDKLVQIK